MRKNLTFIAFAIAFVTTALVILDAQQVTVSSGVNTLVLGGSPGLTSGGRLTLPTASGGFYIRETSNFQAVAGGCYGVDTTSGAVTVTPPLNPVDGEFFVCFDVARQWGAHSPLIGTAGNNFIFSPDFPPAPGPYTFPTPGQIPRVFFVWDSAISAWSVQY
jgi:hypothetical protein